MAKLFFLLSGESESLPAAEVKAILEAEGYRYSNVEVLDQTLRLESELSSVQAVQIRAAFTRLCALELFKSDATETEISKTASNTDFKAVLKPGESFSVRINRIKNYADQAINTMRLEGKLGKIILQRTEDSKSKPQKPRQNLHRHNNQRKTRLRLKTHRNPNQNLLRTQTTQKTVLPPVRHAVETCKVHGEFGAWKS